MTADHNPKPIKSKKSETLEVRIPFDAVLVVPPCSPSRWRP